MLCKNCNYILTGSENFCPNCASSVKAVKLPENEKAEIEQVPVREENIISKEYIFPEVKDEEDKKPQLKIFSDVAENDDEPPQSAAKKSYAGKILFLIFLICAFTASSFAVIDYFDLTSSVFSFVSNASQVTEKETPESLFNHKNSVVKPDISYTPSSAYVMSGKGLTLRKGPDKSYAPLCNLSDLTEVRVYGAAAAENNWVYVYCSSNESYGWLDAAFISGGTIDTQAPEISGG